MVYLNNSMLNEKLTMSMVNDTLFNEEGRSREMGTAYGDELRALVSQGSRKIGQGRGRDTSRG